MLLASHEFVLPAGERITRPRRMPSESAHDRIEMRGALAANRRFGAGTNKRIEEIERSLDRPIGRTDQREHALPKCLPFAERLRALTPRTRCARARAHDRRT